MVNSIGIAKAWMEGVLGNGMRQRTTHGCARKDKSQESGAWQTTSVFGG
jgi:hypothetical protein